MCVRILLVSFLLLYLSNDGNGEKIEGFCSAGDSSCRWASYLASFKSAFASYKDEPCANQCCFTELIAKDLSPFSSLTKKDLDSSRNAVRHAVTYMIIQGELYRSPNCLFPARCKGIEYFLHRVKKSLKKDVEFVVGVQDWPHVNKYSLSSEQRIPPVFSFSKTSDYFDISYPAWTFKEGGPAISLYPRGLGEWDLMRERILNKEIPWKDKKQKAFFRGSRTSFERDNLILLSRKHPELVDAKYTKNQSWKSEKDTLNAPPAEEVSLEDHCQYKYLFNYRGVAASFRFKHLFLCESLVFHIGNEWIEFFYHSLKPWVHYVPVSAKATQEEIKDLLYFFNANQEVGEIIARTGYELIKNNLTNDQVECYWRELLNSFGALLTYNPKVDSSFIHLRQ